MRESSHASFPTQTSHNKTRRAGFELEFAALNVSDVSKIIKDVFGGSIEASTVALHHVKDTEFGSFTVELDAKMVKKLAKFLKNESDSASKDTFITPEDYANFSNNIASLAGKLVPVEIVTPPLPFDDIPKLDKLCAALQTAQAEGTHRNAAYAFGLHINPELPSLSPDVIIDYLCAYVILYDWLVKAHNVDLTRRISTYIAPYKHAYVTLILEQDYAPDTHQLIDDYMQLQPSRNYALDMLPLFAYLDAEYLAGYIVDERIKARPTFHYRLPNCDIDQKSWSISGEWERWLMVEKLANNKALLEQYKKEYLTLLNTPLHSFSKKWIDEVTPLVDTL